MNAHNGPALTVAYHPDNSRYLASGGRDKFLKLWDWSSSSATKPLASLTAMASLSRVQWRPGQNTHQIASTSLLTDTAIHVWDFHRPHIPFYSLEEHDNVVTVHYYCYF